MASVEDILDRLGGPDAAARLTGVGLEAIRKWRQARSIPSKHWSAVIAAGFCQSLTGFIQSLAEARALVWASGVCRALSVLDPTK